MSKLERFTVGESTPKDQYEKDLEITLDKIFQKIAEILNNGIRFNENFDAAITVVTTNATPGVETAVAHGLKRVPLGCMVLEKTAAGHLYRGASGKDATNYYVASDIASLTARIIIF